MGDLNNLNVALENVKVDKRLFSNSISFLHNINWILPEHAPALKSFYTIKRRLLEARNKIFLPVNTKRPIDYCSRCLIHFSDEQTKFKVEKCSKSKFALKVIKKSIDTEKQLTPYQERYLRRFTKTSKIYDTNNLVIECANCYKTINFAMRKPQKQIETIEIPDSASKKSKRKRKNKRKDQYCGLNINAVKPQDLNDASTSAKQLHKLQVRNNTFKPNSKKLNAKNNSKLKSKLNAILTKQPTKKKNLLNNFLQTLQ